MVNIVFQRADVFAYSENPDPYGSGEGNSHDILVSFSPVTSLYRLIVLWMENAQSQSNLAWTGAGNEKEKSNPTKEHFIL